MLSIRKVYKCSELAEVLVSGNLDLIKSKTNLIIEIMFLNVP